MKYRGGSGGFGENEVLNDFEVVTLMLSDFLRADVPQSFPDCGRGAFRAMTTEKGASDGPVFCDRPVDGEEVVKNIPNVRAEKGCIRYDFHKNRSEDGTFLFYEIWESPEALDAHGKTPHMLAYKERTKELLACPTVVTVWSQVDCR